MIRRAAFGLVLAASSVVCRAGAPETERAPATATEGRGHGTLVGTVTLAEGVDIPTPRVIQNTTDPEVCGESHTLDDVAVDPESRGILSAIVAVTDAPAEPRATAPVTIDNRGCRFQPHVTLATVGSVLETTNSDPVLHTTHLYGPREFNLSLSRKGARQRRPLAAPGLFVVKCDVHGWMQAYIRVGEHPYHATTDASGGFRIEGIPAGARRLEIWHERLGTLEREVAIAPGETTRVSFSFPFEEELSQ